jgi:hypothetical protein
MLNVCYPSQWIKYQPCLLSFWPRVLAYPFTYLLDGIGNQRMTWNMGVIGKYCHFTELETAGNALTSIIVSHYWWYCVNKLFLIAFVIHTGQTNMIKKYSLFFLSTEKLMTTNLFQQFVKHYILLQGRNQGRYLDQCIEITKYKYWIFLSCA